jgi:formyl-CoA transferase
MLRISGYGQTGPYRDKPGFGALGEAMGGLRHLTGEPGRVRCAPASRSATRSPRCTA